MGGGGDVLQGATRSSGHAAKARARESSKE